MRVELRTGGVDETREVGAAVAEVLRPGDVVLLAGELGTGKTALAQGLARGLGIEDRVTSPSFVIVREYEGRIPLAHVDVYRLDHAQELHDLGFEEVLDPGRVTVVEWGDRVAPMLPAERLEVRLAFGDDDATRLVECSGLGPSWAARREVLEASLERWGAGGPC